MKQSIEKIPMLDLLLAVLFSVDQDRSATFYTITLSCHTLSFKGGQFFSFPGFLPKVVIKRQP